MQVPFFRPEIGSEEIDAVTETLRSGWLTTGPRTREFEKRFAEIVGARHAVALNSCTAALHLALEALGLRAGDRVLVPTMTFAATAEVVRYFGAVPVLVDCDPVTLNLDMRDAQARLDEAESGAHGIGDVVGIIPVHVGGLMLDMPEICRWARSRDLWVLEDAAHAFPAAIPGAEPGQWNYCGGASADITCFSFYANKTITTGEGGMATCENRALSERMRLMSLHGLSRDAWNRFTTGSKWDYRIIAPGYKYNLTDMASALGICQLDRAEAMRQARQLLAERYRELLSEVEEIELPPHPENRIHSWHLYPIRIRLEALSIDRDGLIEALAAEGVGTSVHWRPLHRHPYYESEFALKPTDYPVASAVWKRLISLPLFPSMREEEVLHVGRLVRRLCQKHAR